MKKASWNIVLQSVDPDDDPYLIKDTLKVLGWSYREYLEECERHENVDREREEA